VRERFYLIVLVVFAAIGLVFGTGLVYIRTPQGTSTVRRWASKELQANTGLAVGFTTIDYDLLPPRLRIQGVEVKDSAGRVDIRMEELEITPEILPLFAGHLRLEEVYLNRPRIKATIESQPESKKTGAGEKESQTNITQLRNIQVITVTDGSLEVSFPGFHGSKVAANNIGLDITSEPGGLTEVRALILGGYTQFDKTKEPIDRLEIRAGIGEKGLTIRKLLLDSGDARVMIQEGHVPFETKLPEGIDVEEMSVDIPLPRLSPYPIGLPAATGVLSFSGKGGWHGGPVLKGRLVLKQGAIPPFRIGDVESVIALDPAGVSFSETSIRDDFGRVGLTGRIRFDDTLATEVKADLDEVELARLLDHVTVDSSKVLMKMNGQIRLTGSLKPLALDGNLDLKVHDFVVRDASYLAQKANIILDFNRAKVVGGLAINDKAVKVKSAVVDLPNTKIAVNARFAFDNTWSLDAVSGSFDLDDLGHIAGFRMSGRGPLKCRIHGIYDDPVVEGEADIAQMRFDKYRFGRIRAGVWFQTDRLVFSRLEVERNLSRYRMEEATLKFGGPNGLEIFTKASLQRLALPDIFATFNLLGPELEQVLGDLSGTVVLHYRERPFLFTVDVDLVHSNVSLYGERFGDGTIRGRYRNGEYVLDEMLLAKGDGIISLTGRRGPDGALDLLLVGESVDLRDINHPWMRKADAQAKAQLVAVVKGTQKSPEGTITLRVGPMIHAAREFGPTNLRGFIHGNRITIEGEAFGGDVAITPFDPGKGTGTWIDIGNGAWNLEAKVHELELAGFLAVSDVAGKGQTSIRYGGEAHVAGGPGAKGLIGTCLEGYGPAAAGIIGCLRAESLTFRAAGYQFENDQPITLALLGDRIETNRAVFQSPGATVAFSGGADLDGPRRFRVRFLIDLRLAAPFLSWTNDISGLLEINVNLYGTWDRPSLLGFGNLREGMLSIKGVPHRIDGVSGRLKFGMNRVTFDGFTGSFADSRFSLVGEMLLMGFRPSTYSFDLSASDLHLRPMDYLTLTADAALKLASPASPTGLPMVTGDLNLQKLRFTKPVKLMKTITELTRTRTAGAASPLNPENDVFGFDIRLHGAKDLVAQNHLFTVDIQIDDSEKPLRLVGTNQVVGLLGRIIAYQGTLTWQATRFDLTRGVVEFEDRFRIENPWFDVAASTEKRDYQIMLQAQGTLDNYRITLSSSPDLAEEDIAFLLTVGMTRGEADQLGGGTVVLDPLVESLELDQGVGELLPIVDEVRVTTEYSEQTGRLGPRLGVEKQITRGLNLGASSGVGEQKDFRTDLELKLSKKLSLDAVYNSDDYSPFGDIGLELKLHHEF